MRRPEPILPEKERKILLEVYENPDTAYDTFSFTDTFTSGLNRSTPEYADAFKETVKVIESLVEQGLIDGRQLKGNIGMHYTELKLKFKGKQVAIREKRRIERLEEQMPEFLKRADEVAEEIRAAQEKE